MDVNQTIEELCATYGVPRAFGERVRPLIERAFEVPPPKRDRLLQLVERSFAEEARLSPRTPPMKSRLTPQEISTLKTVAGILHGWSPPVWLSVWEQHLRGDDAS